MDATDLLDSIREERKTELSRLGSSKTLYALTEGEMEPEAVLAAAADTAHHAAEVLSAWRNVDTVGLATSASEVADTEIRHYETIAGELDGHDPGPPPAVVAVLGDQPGAIPRAGSLLAWALVSEKHASQFTGFFTGQADPQTASLFREFRGDYEEYLELVGETLDDLCEPAADWDRAEAAALSTVDAGYDEYVETLESLGVNPKPVC